MAKVRYIEPVASISGKFCKHSNTVFNYCAETGATWMSRICNPYKGEPTSAQLALRDKFKQAQAQARADIQSAEKAPALIAAFKQQRKYKTLFGYVFAQKYKTIA